MFKCEYNKFVETLAKNLESVQFMPTQWHGPPKVHVPAELQKCEKVWVRVNRVKKPLEAPYTGPFSAIKRCEKFFVLQYPSGKCDTVSIDRLKPFYDCVSTQINHKEMLQKLKKNADEFCEDQPEDDRYAISSDDEEEESTLPNHIKFAKKIAFKTRSGRTVRFSSTNQINLIPPEGRGRPVPKR